MYNCYDDKYDATIDWTENGFPGEFVYGDDYYVDEYYDGERWKKIYGYYGYWISNFGRVYGPGRGGKGQFLKPVQNSDGYYKVTLCNDIGRKDKRVNRLVAEAFIPNPFNYPVVMHIDNDPTNNHISNLAWGTYEENSRWCWACGRHDNTITDGIRELAFQARRTPIIAIDIYSGKREYFISQREAARALGVSQQHIWGVLNGYRRSTGGYAFEYAEDEVDDYGAY